MKKIVLIVLIALGNLHGWATAVNRTLFINRGNFVTVKNTSFPFLAFNNSPVFSSLNTVIKINPGDSLFISVINNDNQIHGFSVKGYSSINLTVNPGDTVTSTYVFPQEGIFIYYDHLQYPINEYLGLGGMICVRQTNANIKEYTWNIKEHQTGFNNQLASGNSVNWKQYSPDYFTINGKSFPDLQNDSTAVINVQVGDTVRIYITNTGHSSHSIHFHGFHTKAVFSSYVLQKDWEKDTWPLRSMQGLILEFVPDKPGKYSVHDHNLVAVSGGGTHPNGMFLIMNIQ